MFLQIENKFTFRKQIVEELSDFLFEEGWRFVKYVSNTEVNIFEADENKRQNSIKQYGF